MKIVLSFASLFVGGSWGLLWAKAENSLSEYSRLYWFWLACHHIDCQSHSLLLNLAFSPLFMTIVVLTGPTYSLNFSVSFQTYLQSAREDADDYCCPHLSDILADPTPHNFILLLSKIPKMCFLRIQRKWLGWGRFFTLAPDCTSLCCVCASQIVDEEMFEELTHKWPEF